MKFRTNLKLKSGIIEPAPLVDIVIQVIIFFVLATQFIGRPGLLMELPQVQSAALYKESATRVAVTTEGFFFQDKAVTIEQLDEELGRNAVSVLVIEADKEVSHSKVVEVIELAQRQGISQIAIAAECKK